jgi:hypothetical protein
MQDRFEQIRDEIEARQRSILWPDYLRATRNTYDFLWNGDPKPKMVQRIGLALFGMYLLTTGICAICVFSSGELGWLNPANLVCALQILFSLRVLRNAFVPSRAPALRKDTDQTENSGK